MNPGEGGGVTPYIKVYEDVPQVWAMFSHLLLDGFPDVLAFNSKISSEHSEIEPEPIKTSGIY